MNKEQAITQLTNALTNFDWFVKVDTNQTLSNSLTVYVDKMSVDILTTVPDAFEGFDVRVHFAISSSDKYIEAQILAKELIN